MPAIAVAAAPLPLTALSEAMKASGSSDAGFSIQDLKALELLIAYPGDFYLTIVRDFLSAEASLAEGLKGVDLPQKREQYHLILEALLKKGAPVELVFKDIKKAYAGAESIVVGGSLKRLLQSFRRNHISESAINDLVTSEESDATAPLSSPDYAPERQALEFSAETLALTDEIFLKYLKEAEADPVLTDFIFKLFLKALNYGFFILKDFDWKAYAHSSLDKGNIDLSQYFEFLSMLNEKGLVSSDEILAWLTTPLTATEAAADSFESRLRAMWQRLSLELTTGALCSERHQALALNVIHYFKLLIKLNKLKALEGVALFCNDLIQRCAFESTTSNVRGWAEVRLNYFKNLCQFAENLVSVAGIEADFVNERLKESQLMFAGVAAAGAGVASAVSTPVESKNIEAWLLSLIFETVYTPSDLDSHYEINWKARSSYYSFKVAPLWLRYRELLRKINPGAEAALQERINATVVAYEVPPLLRANGSKVFSARMSNILGYFQSLVKYLEEDVVKPAVVIESLKRNIAVIEEEMGFFVDISERLLAKEMDVLGLLKEALPHRVNRCRDPISDTGRLLKILKIATTSATATKAWELLLAHQDATTQYYNDPILLKQYRNDIDEQFFGIIDLLFGFGIAVEKIQTLLIHSEFRNVYWASSGSVLNAVEISSMGSWEKSKRCAFLLRTISRNYWPESLLKTIATSRSVVSSFTYDQELKDYILSAVPEAQRYELCLNIVAGVGPLANFFGIARTNKKVFWDYLKTRIPDVLAGVGMDAFTPEQLRLIAYQLKDEMAEYLKSRAEPERLSILLEASNEQALGRLFHASADALDIIRREIRAYGFEAILGYISSPEARMIGLCGLAFLEKELVNHMTTGEFYSFYENAMKPETAVGKYYQAIIFNTEGRVGVNITVESPVMKNLNERWAAISRGMALATATALQAGLFGAAAGAGRQVELGSMASGSPAVGAPLVGALSKKA